MWRSDVNLMHISIGIFEARLSVPIGINSSRERRDAGEKVDDLAGSGRLQVRVPKSMGETAALPHGSFGLTVMICTCAIRILAFYPRRMNTMR